MNRAMNKLATSAKCLSQSQRFPTRTKIPPRTKALPQHPTTLPTQRHPPTPPSLAPTGPTPVAPPHNTHPTAASPPNTEFSLHPALLIPPLLLSPATPQTSPSNHHPTSGPDPASLAQSPQTTHLSSQNAAPPPTATQPTAIRHHYRLATIHQTQRLLRTACVRTVTVRSRMWRRRILS
jgi:hypothetical protein